MLAQLPAEASPAIRFLFGQRLKSVIYVPACYLLAVQGHAVIPDSIPSFSLGKRLGYEALSSIRNILERVNVSYFKVMYCPFDSGIGMLARN